MKKIRTNEKRNVLIKVGILVLLPLPLMLLFVIAGLIGKQPCFFSPGRSGHHASFFLDSVYPSPSIQDVEAEVDYRGNFEIFEGDTTLWEGEIDLQGRYSEARGKAPSYTLFWVPVYFKSMPFARKHWMRKMTDTSMVDLTGFFGDPGSVFAIAIKDSSGKWFKGRWSDAGNSGRRGDNEIRVGNPVLADRAGRSTGERKVQELFFIGPGNSVAGRASYDTSTGMLVSAVSFARNGTSMELKNTSLRGKGFRDYLLPVVMMVAVALAFIEVFYTSVREARKKPGLITMPVKIDFAMYGYTAVLVDIYFDLVMYDYGATPIIWGVHVLMAGFIWFRFGWWSVLPLLEIALALFSLGAFDDATPAFTFFPASFGAVIMALLAQGHVSPGKLPKLRLKEKFLGARP